MKRVTYMSARKLPMAIIIYYIEFNPTKLSCLLKLWPKEGGPFGKGQLEKFNYHKGRDQQFFSASKGEIKILK